MKIITGINPKNDKQARILFCTYAAHDIGEKRHPLFAMKQLSVKMNFKILFALPQTLADGWDFWIEHNNIKSLEMPKLFRENIKWKKIGVA